MIDVKEKWSAVSSDMCLGLTAVNGLNLSVRNCWHFYTAGDSVDVMFHNEDEFKDGMNRIPVVAEKCDILILAFVLMDTHVHFILYGDMDSCTHFMHEYVRRTSIYLSSRYHKRNALKNIIVGHQKIDDDSYLKKAICYVLKNPVSAGLPYNPWDYPWSSGALYFRRAGYWTSPQWLSLKYNSALSHRELSKVLKSKVGISLDTYLDNGMVLPNQYVEWGLVEKIFRSPKAFNYFLYCSRDTDVESRGGAVSHLSIPLNEMRENRKILLQELFGVSDIRVLNTSQRIHLARCMKSRYNSSSKQIAKLCGLVYKEVQDYF